MPDSRIFGVIVKSVHSLYGVKSMNARDAAFMLKRLTGIDFHPRESSYKGGEYFISDSSFEGEVTVEANWADRDGYPSEPDHGDFGVLVYVNSVDVDVLADISVSEFFVLLRSEEF